MDTEKKLHKTDVAIIGAGPVGLFSVFECGMLKMKCHVIDTLHSIGGQCIALYPEKPIYDIPGYPQISATDLISKLEEQIKPFDPTFHLGQQVVALNKNNDNNTWQVTTSENEIIEAKAVIIAAGVGAFGPNRPPLEGIEEYEGKSVHYMVKKREDFRGKKIVIAGGGDSAIDWVLSLHDLAEKIYLIHRRPKFRAAPETVSQVQQLHDQGKIEMVIPYQLAGLKGQNGHLEAVSVKTLSGEERVLEADTLLPFYGLSMNLGPISEWGLNLEHNHIAVNNSDCETNIEGIFAIGDIAHYQGKLKLILTGFSEGAMAAHKIHRYVYPDQELHFQYSTTKGVEAI